MKTFEQYLQDQFWKQYNGLDDEAPEAEADWMAELEPQDWIDHATNWVMKKCEGLPELINREMLPEEGKKWEWAKQLSLVIQQYFLGKE